MSGAILIAAIYVFFLLFAQFGFLQGLRDAGHGTPTIQAILGVMAFAGIIGSFVTPLLIRRLNAPQVLLIGLLATTAAGTWAAIILPRSTSIAVLQACSALVGFGLGLATVALAADLRRLTQSHATGLTAGIGTGLAYCFCNLPAVFNATPSGKAWIAAAATALAAPAAWRRQEKPGARVAVRNLAVDLPDAYVTWRGVACVTAAFLALIWFDSAAFAAVQNEATLRARFWTGTGLLTMVAVLHAIVAVIAGVLVDRQHFRAVLAAALVLLAAGHLGFGAPTALQLVATPLYVAGVSLYSTALVAYAALARDDGVLVSAPWRATWTYAIAGWLGSAAGVGLAEQFGRVPAWVLPVALVVLAAALHFAPGRKPFA